MRSLLVAASVLALAACGQQSSTTVTTDINGNTTTTTTTGGAPAAASLGIQAGRWETTIDIIDQKFGDLPGGIVPPKPGPVKLTTCVTPEQAAKGPGDLLKAAGMDCTTTTSNYAGGRIDMSMTCKMPTGTLTSHSTGTYSATEMSAEGESSMTGSMSFKQKARTTARRIGDCS